MAKTSDLQAQRRQNLKQVVHEMGDSPTTLANAMGLSGPSFISQMTGGSRTISDKSSRRIEQAAGKPDYWLDQPHTGENPTRNVNTDPSFVNGAVQAVVAVQQQLKAQISAEKYAEIVELVYTLAQKEGTVNHDYARRLVKLTM